MCKAAYDFWEFSSSSFQFEKPYDGQLWFLYNNVTCDCLFQRPDNAHGSWRLAQDVIITLSELWRHVLRITQPKELSLMFKLLVIKQIPYC